MSADSMSPEVSSATVTPAASAPVSYTNEFDEVLETGVAYYVNLARTALPVGPT